MGVLLQQWNEQREMEQNWSPSNWELQGFGSYLYGKVNKEITNADFINTSSQFQKSGRRNVFILFLKGQ